VSRRRAIVRIVFTVSNEGDVRAASRDLEARHPHCASTTPKTRTRTSMNPDIIGWAASAILLATLTRQIWKQSKEGDDAGVSRWLFVGQSAASLGFVIYSVLLDNWVFIITNSCILVTAIVGQWMRARRDADD